MAGTTHTLFHPDNDSLRILFPNYRCEQERVEMRNNLKKTIVFVRVRIQGQISPIAVLSFLAVFSLLQMKRAPMP